MNYRKENENQIYKLNMGISVLELKLKKRIEEN